MNEYENHNKERIFLFCIDNSEKLLSYEGIIL